MGNIIRFPISSARYEHNENERVMSIAVIRSAIWLGVSNVALSRILELPEIAVDRISEGNFYLKDGTISYKKAKDFILIFEGLYEKLAGDQKIASNWMSNENLALYEKPVIRMQRAGGLEAVKKYIQSVSIP